MPFTSLNINALSAEQIRHRIAHCRTEGLEIRGTDNELGIEASDFALLDTNKLAVAAASVASLSDTPQLILNLEEMSEDIIDDFVGQLKLNNLSPENLNLDVKTFGEPTFNSNQERIALKLPASKKFVAEIPARRLTIEACKSHIDHFGESLSKNLTLKSLTFSPLVFNKSSFEKLSQALKNSRIDQFSIGSSTRRTQARTLAKFERNVPAIIHQNRLLNKLRGDMSNNTDTQSDQQLMQSRVAKKVVGAMFQASQPFQELQENLVGKVNEFLSMTDAFNVSRSNQKSYQLATSSDNYSHEQIDALRATYALRSGPTPTPTEPSSLEQQGDQKRARTS